MALPELEASGDRLGQTDALLMLAQAYALLGQPDRVIETARQAADLYAEMGLDFNVAGAQLPIAEAYWQKGEPRRAYDILSEVLPRLRNTQDASIELRALSSLGFVCAQLGDLEQGFDLARQTIALAEPQGNAQHLGNAYILLGQLYELRVEPQQALAAYEHAYTILSGSGYRLLAGNAAYLAGILAAARGDNQAAERHLRHAVDHLLDVGSALGMLAAQRLVDLLQARGEAADVNDFLYRGWVAIMERVRAVMSAAPEQRDDLRVELFGRREMITGLVGESDPILPLIDGLIALLDGEGPAPLAADHPLARKFEDIVREIGREGARGV
jgi:tetratricopeptide (TPR) repeat protein